MPRLRDARGRFVSSKGNSFTPLQTKLKNLQEASIQEGKPEVVVGYTAAYAIYVHEDLQAIHPRGGQAKYLEQPAREKRKEIAAIAREAYKEGKSLGDSLVLGGLYLQGESQRLVPVDTGALRASAFTKLEKK